MSGRVKIKRLEMLKRKPVISNAYINQIENGKIKQPSINMLFSLADYYGISRTYMLDLAGFPIDYEKKSDTKLIAAIEMLNNEEKSELYDFIKYLCFKRKQRRSNHG